MSKFDRKKTYVDPLIQGSLVRRLAFHWIAFVLVAGTLSFCLQVLSDPFRPLGEHVQQLWWTHGPLLLVLICMVPVFVLDTIKLSHRFVGPIYRLRKTIRSIAEGKPTPPLKFRDSDFWRSVADDFNQMTDRLSNQQNQSTAEDTADTPETLEVG